MANYLVYWKGFWDDVDDVINVENDWSTRNQSLYNKVKSGDNLWVVVSGGPSHQNEWGLLQRIVVDAANPKPQRSKYGSFHIIGDTEKSQVFDPDSQGDFSALLNKLQFDPAKPIVFEGRKIGQSIQSPRKLTEKDVILLTKYTKQLQAIPAA